MTGQRQKRIRELFESACDKPWDQQETYIAGETGGDEELMAAVAKLLNARRKAGGLLDTPTSRAVEPRAAAPKVGSVIGSYKILRELGSGGMGIVYQVVRADEVFHRVSALKVLRPEYAGGTLLARFRTEREILARLDHPNIARIVDGGSTSAGLPYFVMDYVDGEPVNIFCSRNQLSIAQRLKIFRQVCAAAQYLHDNRVVHSDLKPSNILVGMDGVVKLLDFGIASVLWPTGRAGSLQPPIPLMTPGYASPEQLKGNDIGPASDVYSLGIVLYEVLTGMRPYASEGIGSTELIALIERGRLQPPSSAVTPQNGGYAGDWLRAQRSLRGDLDLIVLHALHKDQQTRYKSAASLEKDIANFLSGLPVTARRSNPIYRGRKFLTRNIRTVAVAAVMTVLLGLNLWQWALRNERHDLAQKHLTMVSGVQLKKVQVLEERRKKLQKVKSEGGAPAQADLEDLQQAQLMDVRELGEAYRVWFAEAVRLWPGMTPNRRDLLDQAGLYLQQAEQIASSDSAREQLALAWLWIAKIEGDPKSPNLHEGKEAAFSIREAERVIEKDSSAPGQKLLRSIRNTAKLIG